LLLDRSQLHHVDRYPWIIATKPGEHRREQTGNDGIVASYSDFSNRRIGEEFDIFHPLTQLIESG
jgi:hypothetical protein